MSRYYAMSVEITGHRPEKADAIRAAATSLWEFSDWSDQDGTLRASAEGNGATVPGPVLVNRIGPILEPAAV
jgi:hypothetical protein